MNGTIDLIWTLWCMVTVCVICAVTGYYAKRVQQLPTTRNWIYLGLFVGFILCNFVNLIHAVMT